MIFRKDANLLDAYQRKFSNNGVRRRKFMAMCHGLTGADLYGLAVSVIFEKNAIRPGSHIRRIEYVNLRDVKATFANYPGLLQKAIADGTTFVDQDTGDFVYPVLKQENTSS